MKGIDTSQFTLTDQYGYYEITVAHTTAVLSFELAGFITQEVTIGQEKTLDVWLNDFKGQPNQVETRNDLTELLESGSPKTKANAPSEVLHLAEGARGADTEGYRIEFINQVKSSRLLVARK